MSACAAAIAKGHITGVASLLLGKRNSLARLRKPSFWHGFRTRFRKQLPVIRLEPGKRLSLSLETIALPLSELPFELQIGQGRLHVYPDQPLAMSHETAPSELILFDPDQYFSHISPFWRLKSGESLAFNRNAEPESHAYRSPGSAFQGYTVVSHGGRALTLQNTLSELQADVMRLPNAESENRVRAHRESALKRLEDIFGGAFEVLSRDEALATLREVNRRRETEPFRPRDSEGEPGGLVELPGEITPIILGDLHGEIDNLLKVLSEGATLESLENGESALVLLGDAVHSQRKREWASMDSSILTMDLIYKLKLRFPGQVFFLLGNHDSFSPEIQKGGVPQGLLWEKRIVELRGEEYRKELDRFYRQSPLVAVSDDFAACHAGPPRTKVSRQTIIDIHRYPKLVHELTWTHRKTTTHPAGYTRRDIESFRNALGLDRDKPVIVGHFPLSQVDGFWLNVGRIPHHHIVYSANTCQIGLFTRIAGKMVPHVYTAEPLLHWLTPDRGEGSSTHLS